MDKSLISIDNHVFIKPEYLNNQYVSGNKLWKLKYNLIEAKKQSKTTLLTFGGAFSNHISAVAYAGMKNGFQTIGIIRGDEHAFTSNLNPTLSFCKSQGMQLKFVTRESYREKTSPFFLKELNQEFGDFFLIPEGGTNELAIKGCEEILNDICENFDYVCCPVGTGGTISGIINASTKNQKIVGFSALKGDFLNKEISKFVTKTNWDLITDYHFGGYAKINTELIQFINDFKQKYNVPLDPIYTGKMMYGVFDLIKREYFKKDSKILVIHTGGLQGIDGMNLKLKQQNKPLIV